MAQPWLTVGPPCAAVSLGPRRLLEAGINPQLCWSRATITEFTPLLRRAWGLPGPEPGPSALSTLSSHQGRGRMCPKGADDPERPRGLHFGVRG